MAGIITGNDDILTGKTMSNALDDLREPIQRAASELPVAARERAERLADGFKSASERVGASVSTAGQQAGDFLAGQMTTMSDRMGKLEDQLVRARTAATVAVRERPLVYLAGAAAFGALIGTLLARPSRKAASSTTCA